MWYKAEFSSLLQSSVSQDSPEIILICWFAAQGTFLVKKLEKLLSMLKTDVQLNIFVKTMIHLVFRILWLIKKILCDSSKLSLLLINFNTSLLKINNLIKKKIIKKILLTTNV